MLKTFSTRYFAFVTFLLKVRIGLSLQQMQIFRNKCIAKNYCNGWKALTIITKRFILDVTSALDPPLIVVVQKQTDTALFFVFHVFQEQHSTGVLRKRCYENVHQMYRRKPISKSNFNKVALQLYWSRTSIWVFSCKFAAYFHKTFS